MFSKFRSSSLVLSRVTLDAGCLCVLKINDQPSDYALPIHFEKMQTVEAPQSKTISVKAGPDGLS